MPTEQQEKAYEDIKKQFSANESGNPEQGPIHKKVIDSRNTTNAKLKEIYSKCNNSVGC